MQITCPHCNTKFIVSKEDIGINGRKVKCSECHYTWHQKLDLLSEKLIDFDILNVSKVTTPIKEEFKQSNSTNVPALLPMQAPRYSYMLPVLLLSIIILVTLIIFQDRLIIPYLPQNCDLRIENIQVENIKETRKIKIFYKIVNYSDYTISMPLVRVRLLDDKQTIIQSQVTDNMNIDLAPKQHINLITEIDQRDEIVAHKIDIMLGNKLDFMLR